MATIAITFTGAQGVLSRTLTLTDAELTRVIAAYKLQPGLPDRSAYTNAQVANGLAGDFGQMIRTLVKTVERIEAEKTVPVTAINIS